MTEYLISEELRDALIGLITLLQLNSERIFHKYSGKSSYRILKDDGKEIKLPFLFDLKRDLEELPRVIEEKEYDAKAEELILIAQQLGLF